VLKKVWATTIALVSCMRLQQKYTLKLPPVYKETKVYIKCYLFRFLSSIYKVVQVQRIQHTARASNQLFPRFLFVLYDCTRYIFQLSVLLYKGTCYQLLQLLQLLPKQQYILKSLCLSPGPGTLLHVALSPILRAVAGCQKTRLCLLCYYYTTFFTLDFVGSDTNNCG